MTFTASGEGREELVGMKKVRRQWLRDSLAELRGKLPWLCLSKVPAQVRGLGMWEWEASQALELQSDWGERKMRLPSLGASSQLHTP